MATVEEDLELAGRVLRRIAGTDPVVEAGRRGPGGASIAVTFGAMKAEAKGALDKLALSAFERESEEALAGVQ